MLEGERPKVTVAMGHLLKHKEVHTAKKQHHECSFYSSRKHKAAILDWDFFISASFWHEVGASGDFLVLDKHTGKFTFQVKKWNVLIFQTHDSPLNYRLDASLPLDLTVSAKSSISRQKTKQNTSVVTDQPHVILDCCFTHSHTPRRHRLPPYSWRASDSLPAVWGWRGDAALSWKAKSRAPFTHIYPVNKIWISEMLKKISQLGHCLMHSWTGIIGHVYVSPPLSPEWTWQEFLQADH